jgi:hypothetical protein
MIMAAIFVFFSAAFVAEMVFSPISGAGNRVAAYQGNSSGNAVLESQVKLVAANFRCACGQCDELFLLWGRENGIAKKPPPFLST